MKKVKQYLNKIKQKYPPPCVNVLKISEIRKGRQNTCRP